jgi:membrane-associated protease RseP (regulator of RpoE activity)
VDGHFSTIIANGSIRSKTGLKFDGSCFFAQSDIVAKGSSTHNGILLAGGKIDVPKTRNSKESKERVEKAEVKENPFGVRFFETADVGTETAMKEGALTITKLTAGSPLTKYGVKEGDVVTQLNDKAIKTANDFRRELRYSVALEAGILHIKRGNENITRIVYFKNGLQK